MADQDREQGRFSRTFSDQELLAIVRDVAFFGRPADPVSISQRDYDQARSGPGLANTPRAYRIAERLKTPWSRVVEIALAGDNRELAIGTRRTKRLRDDLGRDEVVHYLKRVAKHLGVEEMSIGQYEEGRAELIAVDSRRYRHGAQQVRLIPSGQMIVSKAGSWAKALSWAGLKTRQEPTIKRYTAEQALDDFISDFGFLPGRKVLAEYQDARDLMTVGLPSGEDFPAWRHQQMVSGLASRHGQVGPYSGPRPLTLDPAKISLAPAGFAQKIERNLTMARVKADMARALDLAGGRTLTFREYQHLSATHGLVAARTVQAVGKRNGGQTWGQIRDQVIAERTRKAEW
jgi:hypothetical protein